MKVALDTNVLVSDCFLSGTEALILEHLVKSGRHRVCIPRVVIDETVTNCKDAVVELQDRAGPLVSRLQLEHLGEFDVQVDRDTLRQDLEESGLPTDFVRVATGLNAFNNEYSDDKLGPSYEKGMEVVGTPAEGIDSGEILVWYRPAVLGEMLERLPEIFGVFAAQSEITSVETLQWAQVVDLLRAVTLSEDTVLVTIRTITLFDVSISTSQDAMFHFMDIFRKKVFILMDFNPQANGKIDAKLRLQLTANLKVVRNKTSNALTSVSVRSLSVAPDDSVKSIQCV